MMRFGSLFTGIGGLDLAMERLGFECAWQVEIHPYRLKVLARHWPNVTRYEDVRTIDSSVEPVDMIVAGFPCQPFSVAGKRRGADDERNLWPETIRVIRELRPRYAFLENVPGLLAHEYFGTVLGELAEAGYDAEWGCFTAAQVGASHKRDRLFILAYATEGRLGNGGSAHRQHGVQDATERESEEGIEPGDRREYRAGSDECLLAHATGDIRGASGDAGRGPSDGAGDRDVADTEHVGPHPGERPRGIRRGKSDAGWETESNGTEQSSRSSPQPALLGSFPPGPNDRDAWARVLAEVPSLEPALCRVATGIPDRTHRLAALGDAVVPVQAAMAFKALAARVAAAPVALRPS